MGNYSIFSLAGFVAPDSLNLQELLHPVHTDPVGVVYHGTDQSSNQALRFAARIPAMGPSPKELPWFPVRLGYAGEDTTSYLRKNKMNHMNRRNWLQCTGTVASKMDHNTLSSMSFQAVVYTLEFPQQGT